MAYNKEYYKQYYEKNKKKIIARSITYTKSHYEIHKLRVLKFKKTPKGQFAFQKDMASRRKIAWELTFDEFMKFWAQPCIFGCSIKTIGLDRIDNTQGYKCGNIQSMCWTHNRMKGKSTMQEFIEACRVVICHNHMAGSSDSDKTDNPSYVCSEGFKSIPTPWAIHGLDHVSEHALVTKTDII